MKSAYMVVLACLAICCLAGPSAWAGHAALIPDASQLVTYADTNLTAGANLLFELTALPEGVHIDLAELRIGCNIEMEGEKSVPAVLSAVTEPWEPSVGPAEASPDFTDSLSLTMPLPIGDDQSVVFNVTDLVQWWYDGVVSNNGFYLRLDGDEYAEFTFAQQGTVELVIFYSAAE